jgi:hypothetical protein
MAYPVVIVRVVQNMDRAVAASAIASLLLRVIMIISTGQIILSLTPILHSAMVCDSADGIL